MTSLSHTRVLIVGAGPAGVTAAVQLRRMGVDPRILSPEPAGGLIRVAWRVENFAPAAKGAPGRIIAEFFRRHLERFQIKLTQERVRRILKTNGEPFRIETEPHEYTADFVILACGLSPVVPDLPDFVRPYYHPGYDPPETPAPTLVIGGGDVAFDQAGKLAEAGFPVTLVHRGEKPRALPSIISAAEDAGVRVLRSDVPVWQPGKAGVVREDLPDAPEFQYVFAHIGRKPAPPEILWNEESMPIERCGPGGETACPGLFVAGDICRGRMRHVSIAMGDGMQAALTIAERLQTEPT